MDDAIGAGAGGAERIGVVEIGAEDGDAWGVREIRGDGRFVDEQVELMFAREQMPGDVRAEVAGGAGDQDGHWNAGGDACVRVRFLLAPPSPTSAAQMWGTFHFPVSYHFP